MSLPSSAEYMHIGATPGVVLVLGSERRGSGMAG